MKGSCERHRGSQQQLCVRVDSSGSALCQSTVESQQAEDGRFFFQHTTSSSSISSNMLSEGVGLRQAGVRIGKGQRLGSILLTGPAGEALRAAWRLARALLWGWRATANVVSSLAAATECLSARTMACTCACQVSLCNWHDCSL